MNILKLKDMLSSLPSSYIKILKELKKHDLITYNHSIKVAKISYDICTELKLSKTQKRNAFIAGLFHDIGKIRISPTLLNKADCLTTEEFKHIKKHPYWGYIIARGLGMSKNICRVILQHHERINGKGYPYGLVGDDIKKLSKIVSIADIYSALEDKRSYKFPLKQPEVIKIMQEMNCDEFLIEILKKIG